MAAADPEFFCGNSICKRTSFKREDESQPWPLRCQVCFWLNVPDDQREVFREHPKYQIPTLTTVMVKEGNRLVAYITPKPARAPVVKKSDHPVEPSTPKSAGAGIVKESDRPAARSTQKSSEALGPSRKAAIAPPASSKTRVAVIAAVLVVAAILLIIILSR